jgi:hypothetical protein
MYTNNLSKKLTPPALTAPVEYRLLAAGAIDLRQSNRTMCPFQTLKGEELISDPGDKPGEAREKLLRYVVGSKSIGEGATAQIVPELGQPEFINGVITVKPGQTNLYEFLERSNHNASNPHRNANWRAIFERVDPVGKAEVENEKDDKLFEAISTLRGLSAERKLEFAAAKGLARADDEMAIVTRALNQYVMKSPVAFLQELDAPETKVRAAVSQALELGIIAYAPTDGAYKWREQGVNLYEVPSGFDGKEALIRYLLSADAAPKVQLKELQKQVANATK